MTEKHCTSSDEEPSSSPKHSSRGSAQPHRPKNVFFGFLSKRSTRVEPHPLSDSEITTPNHIGSEARQKKLTRSISHANVVIASFSKCSPLKRIPKQNGNLDLTDNEITPPVRLKLNQNNNRLSHQFSLCCKIDEQPATPPVSVRYKSLPDTVKVTDHKLVTDIKKVEPLPEAISISAPDTPASGLKMNQPARNCYSSPSTHSVDSDLSDCKQPRSIAITACRSRLRVKLLPTGGIPFHIDRKAGGDNIEQTSSSPNIPLQGERNEQIAPPRSISHEGVQTIRRSNNNSMDSLARQSLMAAQVFNLIPTEKARERNFLAGKLAVNSLLGLNELLRVLPSKEVRIFVGTWNMNGQSPPNQMNDFVLPTGVEHVPDLIVIGTQESCSERFEWEVTLQETLGPTHILFHSTSLGTLHLAVFMRRDLVWFCSLPEDASMSVRPGTAFRTKGAVAISFSLFGTSMLFVTSHLTAHQQKVKERVQDVKRIIHSLDLPRNLSVKHKNKDVTQNFDAVYWCGDLNFRLGEPREKLLEWIQHTKFPLPSHLPNGYMHTDQLSSVLADGAAFKGFMEANITFPPTYKYDPGTQQFDTSSKQRAPAYTDRILYKFKIPQSGFRRASTVSGSLSQQTPLIDCIAYDSVPSITSSDHKPVWALFRNNIRPGIDTIPLAAGLFNREVYLEGMRRRLNSSNSESSAVCTIQ